MTRTLALLALALLALALLLVACSSPAATPLVTPEPAFVETQAPIVTDAPVAAAPVRVVEVDEPRAADEEFVSFEELVAGANCEQLPALAQLVLDDPSVPSADALAIVDAIAAEEREKGC
jgi:hypothetical protein